MKFNLLHVASIIAISQAVLMAVVFAQPNFGRLTAIRSRNIKLSNFLLSGMLIIFAILTACSLLLSIRPPLENSYYQRATFVAENLAFLIGPMLLLYVQSLLDEDFYLRSADVIHFMPFVIAEIFAVLILSKYPQLIVWTYPGRIYFSGTVLIQNFLYLAATLKILHSYGLGLKSFLSYIDNSKLSWARFFIVGYIALWSIQLQLFVGWDVLNRPQWCPYTSSLWFLTAFLFFNVMVYLGLMKPELLHHTQKYRYSVLQKSDKEKYREKLVEILEDEKLYLNPSITLITVARKLDLAPAHVSQIINESFRKNFRDFINKYRIEESKRLLSQRNQNLNVLGIAHEAGFNSKSSFNTAFKKHTGVTPKEFRKNAIEF